MMYVKQDKDPGKEKREAFLESQLVTGNEGEKGGA